MAAEDRIEVKVSLAMKGLNVPGATPSKIFFLVYFSYSYNFQNVWRDRTLFSTMSEIKIILLGYLVQNPLTTKSLCTILVVIMYRLIVCQAVWLCGVVVYASTYDQMVPGSNPPNAAQGLFLGKEYLHTFPHPTHVYNEYQTVASLFLVPQKNDIA